MRGGGDELGLASRNAKPCIWLFTSGLQRDLQTSASSWSSRRGWGQRDHLVKRVLQESSCLLSPYTWNSVSKPLALGAANLEENGFPFGPWSAVNLLVGTDEEDWFIGDKVQRKRGTFNLQYPISWAAIANWDNMEKVWHHSFYAVLCVALERHPLMVTEPPVSRGPTERESVAA
ncbi:Actin, Aortic Smooth Muscle [Manis pentadactyla]|nr:Actin, Aortic Smooth Muscle [Manis pentadactyla]